MTAKKIRIQKPLIDWSCHERYAQRRQFFFWLMRKKGDAHARHHRFLYQRVGFSLFCTLRWVYLKVGGTLVLFINKKNILSKFHYKIKWFPTNSNYHTYNNYRIYIFYHILMLVLHDNYITSFYKMSILLLDKFFFVFCIHCKFHLSY